MTAIHLPPLVRSWCQNHGWTMGVIRLTVLQRFATWILLATGGSNNQSSSTTSVTIEKRTNAGSFDALNIQNIALSGIGRVAYLASIDLSNFFLTCYTWFVLATVIMTVAFFSVRHIFLFLVKKEKLKLSFKPNADWNQRHKGFLFQLVSKSY
jgi:Transient receptor potential (TRP) ion channel